MANLNKVDVNIAVSKHTTLDLSCCHQTTGNFMRLQPVGYWWLIKDSDVTLSENHDTMPLGITVPTFGKIAQHVRCFYVPFYTIFPQYSYYRQQVIASGYFDSRARNSSLVRGMPFFKNNVLWNMFKAGFVGGNMPLVQIVTAPAAYDFVDDNGVLYRLTTQGKYVYKILRACGYQINPNSGDDTSMNCLCFLAFCRCYYDWYANSQYLDSAEALALNEIFNYNNPTAALELNATDLENLFRFCFYVTYDSDNYFNGAFDQPAVPNGGQYVPLTFNDISGSSTAASITTSAVVGQAEMVQSSSSSVEIGTQFIHDMLKKVTNMQMRYALSGARPIDRWLSEMGSQSRFDNLNRSIYVGADTDQVNIGTVYSHADTSSAQLGSYAGRGEGHSGKQFKFHADDDGIFIFLNSLVPSAGIVQGVDRHNLDMDVFDLFNPELDGVSSMAISRREVYISNDGSFGGTNGVGYDTGVFGFTGAFGHYKRPLNWVSGDYSLNSVAGANSWNLFRLFDDQMFGNVVSNVRHSRAFTEGSDYSNYDRIFDYKNADFDKFNMNFTYQVSVVAPCKPLFETYDFGETTRKITLSSNGTKLN